MTLVALWSNDFKIVDPFCLFVRVYRMHMMGKHGCKQ